MVVEWLYHSRSGLPHPLLTSADSSARLGLAPTQGSHANPRESLIPMVEKNRCPETLFVAFVVARVGSRIQLTEPAS